jgi:hypothetical protein
MRWRWVLLFGLLVAVGVALSWVDSSAARALFPERPPVEHLFAAPRRRVLAFGGSRMVLYRALGPVGGPFTFWWFLLVGAGAVLAPVAVMVLVPGRAARAARHLGRVGLSVALAAGVASLLLVLALTVLFRFTFVLLEVAPIAWAVAAAAAIFGLAGVSLALGRWLRAHLGPVPPLLAAGTAMLVFVDAGLVPLVGWLVFGGVTVVALGLAVLTRLGSPAGWSIEELDL